jgi:hypothetical protein
MPIKFNRTALLINLQLIALLTSLLLPNSNLASAQLPTATQTTQIASSTDPLALEQGQAKPLTLNQKTPKIPHPTVAPTLRNTNSAIWHDYTTGGITALASEGNVIWAGTATYKNLGDLTGHGLIKIDATTGNIAASYTITNSGLSDNIINAITVDSTGNKWLATSTGVSVFNGNSWVSYTTSNSGLINNLVTSVVIDKAGNKWFGTFGGLSKLSANNSTWTTYLPTNSGLTNLIVWSLAVDNNGVLWVGTSNSSTPSNCGIGGVINKFDGTTWTTFSFDSDYPTTINIDKNNAVWATFSYYSNCDIVVYGDGPVRTYNANSNSWQTFDGQSNPSFAHGTHAVLPDGKGNMWIGGYEPVKFDGVRWQSYTHTSNLPQYNIQAIAIDGAGNKWFGTFGGLFELNDNGPSLATDSNGFDFNYQTGGNVPATQTLNVMAYNAPITWTTSVIYGGGASGWLSLTQSSGNTLPTSPTPISISVTNTNLSTGVYTATLTLNDANNSADFTTVNLILRVGYVYHLPLNTNIVDAYVSHIVIQNPSTSASAKVFSENYDLAGNYQTGLTNNCNIILPLAECIFEPPASYGIIVNLNNIIISSQPLTIVDVNPGFAFNETIVAYQPSSTLTSTTLIPLVMNNAFGSFSTTSYIYNGGAGVVTATLKVYDHNGNLIQPNNTTYLSLAPHSTNPYGPVVPRGFYGWVEVDGAPGSQLAVINLEDNGSFFKNGFNTQTTPNTTLYAPTVFNDAFGGYNTGASILNPNPNPVNLTITYYDHNGVALPPASLTIAAHATAAIYHGGSQGAAGGNGIPVGGLPDGFYGSAVVTSSAQGNAPAGIVMMANEIGPSFNNQIGTPITPNSAYLALAGGKTSLNLPIMAKNGYGFTTGATLLNVSEAVVTVNIEYYNLDGTPVSGASSTVSVVAHGSLAIYQGAEKNLPANFYGTAVITGSSSSLIVTTNAISADSFYTYTEPGP